MVEYVRNQNKSFKEFSTKQELSWERINWAIALSSLENLMKVVAMVSLPILTVLRS